jgi:uncharacterized membrane protein YgcG
LLSISVLLPKKSETIGTTSENFNLLGPYIKGFAEERTFEAEQVTDTVSGVTVTERMVPQLSDDEKKEIDRKINAMQLEMDKLFKDSEKRALNNYHLNLTTNVIIIIFGVVLLSLSIYFGFFNADGFTPFAGIAAAGGVANFIALFFSNPQTRLRRLIGDLVQMRMINASWVMEINTAYMQIKIDNYKLDTVIKVQKAISRITRAAVKDIENYIGSDSNSTGSSSSSTTTEGTTRGDSGGNGGNGGDGKGPGGSGAAQGGNNPQQPQANQMQRSQQQQSSAATVGRRKIYNSDGKPVSR